jgi:hypothetical protein
MTTVFGNHSMFFGAGASGIRQQTTFGGNQSIFFGAGASVGALAPGAMQTEESKMYSQALKAAKEKEFAPPATKLPPMCSIRLAASALSLGSVNTTCGLVMLAGGEGHLSAWPVRPTGESKHFAFPTSANDVTSIRLDGIVTSISATSLSRRRGMAYVAVGCASGVVMTVALLVSEGGQSVQLIPQKSALLGDDGESPILSLCTMMDSTKKIEFLLCATEQRAFVLSPDTLAVVSIIPTSHLLRVVSLNHGSSWRYYSGVQMLAPAAVVNQDESRAERGTLISSWQSCAFLYEDNGRVTKVTSRRSGPVVPDDETDFSNAKLSIEVEQVLAGDPFTALSAVCPRQASDIDFILVDRGTSPALAYCGTERWGVSKWSSQSQGTPLSSSNNNSPIGSRAEVTGGDLRRAAIVRAVHEDAIVIAAGPELLLGGYSSATSTLKPHRVINRYSAPINDVAVVDIGDMKSTQGYVSCGCAIAVGRNIYFYCF